MRILFVSYELPPIGGGTGKTVLQTARRMRDLGHEVAILTSRFKGDGGLPAEEDFEGIAILRIPVLRRHLNYANAVEVMSFAAASSLWRGWVTRRFVPDAVLAYPTLPCGTIGLELNLLRKVPYLVMLQGPDVPGHAELNPWFHRAAWPATSMIWRRARHVVANSRALAQLVNVSAPRLDVKVVTNAVDAAVYSPPPEGREARTSPGIPIRVGYVGRLRKVKRLRELAEAWGRVAAGAGRPVELLVAGFGPEREPVEEILSRQGSSASVRFLGRIEEPEVIATLRASDLFVNISEMEGMPGAVLEAMATGLPVVLSDIGPHRELTPPGEAGLFCDGASPASVAQAILDLVKDDPARLAMGRAARAIVESKFSFEAIARQIEGLLGS